MPVPAGDGDISTLVEGQEADKTARTPVYRPGTETSSGFSKNLETIKAHWPEVFPHIHYFFAAGRYP